MGTRRGLAEGSNQAGQAKTACGVIAGPLFVSAFAAIGARRAGYDWRRHAVSSLGAGRDGWAQRANFIVTGALYCVAAQGLAQSPAEAVAPVVIPPMMLAAGAGLIGSGVFVTDPVNGFPPVEQAPGDRFPPGAPTRAGTLHNLCAVPIFLGIPIAAATCAAVAALQRDHRWAAWCAASAIGMAGTTVLFGAGFGGAPRLTEHAGAFQRISIATGFGWLSALSVRALRASRRA
jgi:hypothetical protein